MTRSAEAPLVAAGSSGAPTSTRRSRMRTTLTMLGPAFVAAVAYVDPGNFATNFSGGASFGYLLLWVIVMANLMAMLIQTLTAKLGLATGRDLASLCRERFPRPVTWGLWLQAEAVAIATDIAEIVGGAVALNLLFGIPLTTGGVIAAVVAFALLALQSRGHRPFEVVIAGLLAVIGLGFLYTLIRSGADPAGMAAGLVPQFQGVDSVLLATGILGATVMPHVIYVHSALVPDRYGLPAGVPRRDLPVGNRRSLLRAQRIDVVIAMGLAGVVNAAMLVIAARLFFGGRDEVASLEEVHAGLGTQIGSSAAIAFGIALLASGLAASAVGTYAGQVIMAGFLRKRIPLLARRLLTVIPALAILASGADPTQALVWSQVVLSFGIPFALVPLIYFTSRPALMGPWINRRLTTIVASVVAALIIGLNAFLLVNLATG